MTDDDVTIDSLRRYLQETRPVVHLDEAAATIAGIRSHITARRRGFISVAAVIATVVAIAVGSTIAYSDPRGPSVASGDASVSAAAPLVNWAPRGNRVNDADLISAAINSLGSSSSNTRALYAGVDPARPLATIVVLLNTIDSANIRLAFITSEYPADTTAKLTLAVRSEYSLPYSSAPSYVGFTDSGSIGGSSSDLRTVSVALLAPGSPPSDIVSSIYDFHESDTHPRSDDGVIVAALINQSSVWNTYLTNRENGAVVRGGVMGTGQGDITPLPGRIVRDESGVSVLLADGEPVPAGYLVVTPQVLLGMTSDGGSLNNNIADAGEFCAFVTLQSGYAGSIRRSGGTYQFVVKGATPLGLGRVVCLVEAKDGTHAYINVGRAGDNPQQPNMIAYDSPSIGGDVYVLAAVAQH